MTHTTTTTDASKHTMSTTNTTPPELDCSEEVCVCRGMELWEPCPYLYGGDPDDGAARSELLYWGDQYI